MNAKYKIYSKSHYLKAKNSTTHFKPQAMHGKMWILIYKNTNSKFQKVPMQEMQEGMTSENKITEKDFGFGASPIWQASQ